MVTIYTKDFTSRHNYVFRLVFEHWLHTEWRRVQNEEEFSSAEGILVRYDESSGKRGLFIKSSGFLSEHAITSFSPEINLTSGIPCLYPYKDNSAVLSFDIFSAVFWMVSRYEEYLPFKPDIHGRFDLSESFAFKNGVHNKPIVDLWIIQLIEAIQKVYPGFKPEIKPYNFLPTYDIDQAWSYLNKPTIRCIGAATRNILKGKLAANRERIAVLSGKVTDPFDSYDLQLELQEKYHLSPIYFIHPGTYGKYDKNIPLKHKEFQKLIFRLREKAQIGIHASYRSFKNIALLKKEIDNLSDVINAPITMCRNHFLRIAIPQTYRDYISCGITDDYSLGWASDNGFRAGTSRNFPFYDLEKEKETILMIHPLAMMDGALKNYRKLKSAEAIAELKELIRQVKETNGTFVSLWHNESLGSSVEWSGWKKVYENMIIEALPEQTKAKLQDRNL